MISHPQRATLTTIMVMLLAFVAVMQPGFGSIVTSSVVDDQLKPDRQADMAIVQAQLEKKVVQARLAKLGYTTNEIQQRLERMDDTQLHQLALQVDDLETAGYHGVVIGIFLIVAIVLVVIFAIEVDEAHHHY